MHLESPSKAKAARNDGPENTLVDGLLSSYQFNSSILDNSLLADDKETECLNPVHTFKGTRIENNFRETDVHNEASRYFLLRLLHSILSGLNYGMALMLMLVAMTFNPLLFLALVIGFSIGDFVFFVKMRPQSSLSDCH